MLMCQENSVGVAIEGFNPLKSGGAHAVKSIFELNR